MADEDFGLSISQEGIPVNRAADYQKVLDSRWRFMEVEQEFPINLTVPAVTNPGAFYNNDTILAQHSLGFLPAFEAYFTAPGYSVNSRNLVIYSDTRTIFLRQIVDNGSNPTYTLSGNVRIYNLPILENFEVPKEPISPSSGTVQTQGFRSLDGSVPNLRVNSQSSVGYSIDTTKKILSVHKTGFVDINAWVRRGAVVTAIDTTTDILTLSDPGLFADSMASWINTKGLAMRYNPSDFVTYPGGLSAATVYTIPVDSTHIKFANSYNDAINGIAINITSTGSAMPNNVGGAAFPGGDDSKIIHNVGYPPTYLIANVTPVGNSYIIEPLLNLSGARIRSTATYLEFGGVQAVFAARMGYVILKDPAELVL